MVVPSTPVPATPWGDHPGSTKRESPPVCPPYSREPKSGRKSDEDKEGTTQLEVSKYSHSKTQNTGNDTDESTQTHNQSEPHHQSQCSQSPESANAAVGKATVWSAPRGDAGSIVHTHNSSQTPGKLASVVVYTEPLPQITQLTLLEQISNKRAAAAAAAQELYLMEAAAVAAGLDISITSDQVAAAAGSPIPSVAAAGIPAQPVAAGVLPAPPVAAAVLPTQPTSQ